MKKRILGVGIVLVIIAALIIVVKWDAIFQKGNPIPYIKAMMQISKERTFVAVDADAGIYISKNGDCPELFKYYETTNNLEYVEQAGSGYLFTNGTENFVISSEVYWGKYKVWTLEDTGNSNIDEATIDKLIYGDTFNFDADNSIITDEEVETLSNSSVGAD